MAEPDVEAPETEEEVEEAQDDLSPFLQAIKMPISEDEPAGAKVTYDDDFQQLKTQINEIGAASGDANYETIAELGRKILTEKSKDLRAAGYLVVGEARLNGAPGMAEAVRAIRLLIDTFWEELYPAKRRMRGRGNALKFVADRLGDWMEITEFEQEDREALVAARDDLKAIQDFGLKEMGEHAPALSGLLKKFERAIGKLPEPQAEPEPEQEAESAEAEEDQDSAPTPAAGPTAPAEIASDSDAEMAVMRAATYFREDDKTNPISYRLMRTIRWGVLRKEPPHEGGTTRIEVPREQRRAYLSDLLEQGEYETLVDEAEASFRSETFHFWLDLQRLQASALGALGKPYEDARNVVMQDTALLVQRLPQLPTLTFSDGTPFASPITIDWLETQVQPLLGGDGEGSGRGAGADSSMPVAEHYEEARQKLTSGNLAEALDLMKEGAAQDTTQKESFHRRLYIATLCMKGGQPSVALPLLEDLDEAIARHSIDTWNPPLALEVWTNLCQGYDQMAQQAADADREAFGKRADRAFKKICQLDAAQAVSIAERRPGT